MTNVKIQRQKRVLLVLLGLCGVFGVTLLCGIFAKRADGISGAESVLLNPKYLPQIAEIALESGEGRLLLLRRGDAWLGQTEGLLFEADAQKIRRFLEELCARRTVYELSKNPALYPQYSLDDESAFRIALKLEDSTIASDLYFGGSNYNASRIYVRGGGRAGILQTADTVYPYLHAEPKAWADMRLFRSQSSFNADEILACRINGESISANAQDFNAYLERLRTAKASEILAAEAFSAEEPPAMTIELESLSARFGIEIYRNGENYAVLLKPNLYGANTALEISAWTFQRLAFGGGAICCNIKPKLF